MKLESLKMLNAEILQINLLFFFGTMKSLHIHQVLNLLLGTLCSLDPGTSRI